MAATQRLVVRSVGMSAHLGVWQSTLVFLDCAFAGAAHRGMHTVCQVSPEPATHHACAGALIVL